MLVMLAAGLAGLAVLVAGSRPGGGPGGARGTGAGATRSRAGRTRTAPGSGDWPGWAPWLASAVAGLAAWGLLGGLPGAVAGAAIALGGPRALGQLEPGSRRHARLALVRSAPLVADLMAASLSAGSTLDRSLPVIARAVGGPAGEALDEVWARARLGEPMDLAWARLAGTPGLGGIARTVARSSRSGAPLAAMLATTAEDLRAEAAAVALAEVRSTSVRAVLPLGLCLLPAFTMLGILPVVAGLIPSL